VYVLRQNCRAAGWRWDSLFSYSFPEIHNVKSGIQCVFLTVAIGNCTVNIIPPVNFCFDENIQINFGTKLEDLNYLIDCNYSAPPRLENPDSDKKGALFGS
jgi:hypothetical protein